MARSRPKSPALNSNETLKAALEGVGISQSASQRGALNAALKKVSEGASPPPNATLKAALAKLGAQPANTGQHRAIADTLRKMSENASPPLSPGLKTAIGKAVGQAPPPQQEDLLRTIRKWSDAYGHSPEKSGPHLAGGLKGICRAVETGSGASTAGFRDGLLGSMHLGLDARFAPRDLTGISASDALAGDWRRTERDLWASIEKVTRQLEELPEPTQSRLRAALIRRLSSGGSRG